MNLPAVTGAEIDSMRRLMEVMDKSSTNAPAIPQARVHQGQRTGGHAGQRRALNESRQNIPVAPMPLSTGLEETNAMRDLLERLESVAGDSVQTLVENANTNYPELTNQVITYANDRNSSAFGNYVVKVRMVETTSGSRKLFDLYEADGSLIMEGIAVSSAAQSMAKLLNKGLAMDNSRIQEVVDLEEVYVRNRNDAARFKSRYQTEMQKGLSASADIFEHRYQAARANALAAKDQLDSILESIR